MKRIILPGVNPNHFPEITPISDDIIGVVTAANTVTNITIPDDANFVIFNTDANMYVAYDETPVIPTDTASVGSVVSELNPGQRFIGDKNTISIITAGIAHINVAFFS